jgi:Undecaprenyl-phosphate glucose phosphotransferase
MSVGSEISGSSNLVVASSGVPRKSAISLVALYSTILVLEFLAVALAAYLANASYGYAVYSQVYVLEPIPTALFLATLVVGISIGFRQFVAIQRQPLHMLLWSGVGAVALAFTFFLSTLFLLKISEAYSRGTFVFQFLAICFAVCLIRTIFYFWLQSAISGGLVEARQVVLIGDEQNRSKFPDLVNAPGIRSIASLPFPHHRSSKPGRDCAALVDSKAARQLIDFCRSAHPDDIVILSSQEELPAAPELARLLSELPVNVHIVPLGGINVFGTSRISELGNLKTLQVARPPLSPFEQALKRTFDIVVAMVGLILLAPLLTAVALAIKMESRGPVFFWQKRHGYNNTTINVVKFRTMVVPQQGESFVQAKRNDARITHVGRILRSSNIDELPQLFNVLIGDMSIVGPRPHATAHNQMFEGRILPFSRRHNIKPGITGWAQVNGHRGETDTLEKMKRRVEHDLYYIDNWSVLLDLKIILLTLFSKRSYLNAY